jgi:nuclear RNA export factor
MAIRGASKHLTAGQRIRRNAMSITNPDGATRPLPTRVAAMGVKTLDVWRDFVNRRWNAEARFLNLEVRSRSYV